jgi:protein-S-isoprenylcysteine O-methyltransferase Ste14
MTPPLAWSRWRVRLSYPLAVLFFWLARPTAESLALGALLALPGLLWRAAAAGHLYKHQRLAVSGPYRCTRNPLYFGSALLAVGLLWAGQSWIAALLVTLYFVLSYRGVLRSEEQELRARYGAEFDAYAARVPAFLPSLTPRIPPSGLFSWAQYAVNREYQAALGFAAALALLFLRMRFSP